MSKDRPRTPLRFKLSDGRPLVQTMKAPVHGLAKRKGGRFDAVYHDPSDNLCYLEPKEGRTMIGVVVTDNGHMAECWVVRGVGRPK